MPVNTQQIAAALEKAKKDSKKRNFTQSIDLVITLRNLDLKKPENRINELFELPNPPPKPVKVCVIASGAMAVNAKKAGADEVIDKETLEKLGGDKKAAKKLVKKFDFFIAEAPLMPLVGKTIGSILGPHGKMPTPVPPNAPIDPILEKHRRMIRLRMKDQPVIQCRVGSEDMPTEKVVENIQAVLARLENRLEKGLKNIHQIQVKTTMGPPVSAEL
ncbi:MAG: 50S ribosomal protein L1 [Candidatus Bathyarchaeia archaeon]